MLFDEFVTLGALEVFTHHFGDKLLEGGLGSPTEFLFGFGRVTQESFDFSRTEVAWINLDDGFAVTVIAFFFDALAFPGDGDVEFLGSSIDEVTNAVLHACGNNEVFWMVLLQHEPLHFDVVFGVAPIT